jgi:hypothetical protein
VLPNLDGGTGTGIVPASPGFALFRETLSMARRIKLSQHVVDRLAAPTASGKQEPWWDEDLRGFAVLCSGRTTAKTFICQRDLPGGKSHRVTIASTAELKFAEAKQRARRPLLQMRDGADPKARPKTGTLLEVLEQYVSSDRLSPPRYQARVMRRKWTDAKDLKDYTVSTVIGFIRDNNPEWAKWHDQWKVQRREERRQARVQAQVEAQVQAKEDGPILGEWDAGEDVTKPPPRGWLLGNMFARRFLSILVAEGGIGKSAVQYPQLVSLALGRSLTGGLRLSTLPRTYHVLGGWQG